MFELNFIFEIIGIIACLAALPGTLELVLIGTGALRGNNKENLLRKKPRTAIIIPAHNEESGIKRTIQSLQVSMQSCEQCDVVVIADNCDDETASIASATGARVLQRSSRTRRGKGSALDHAFQILLEEGFEAFIVVDADSVVDRQFIPLMIERFQAGAAALQGRYTVLHPDKDKGARRMDLAFHAFNVLRPLGRSGWGFSAGIVGNGFGVTAETLRKVPYSANSVVEDLEYHLMLVEAGIHVEFVREAAVYGEIPEGMEARRIQRTRWEGGRLRMLVDMLPRSLGALCRRRWALIEPVLDLSLAPLGFHVTILVLGGFFAPGAVKILPFIGLIAVLLHLAQAASLTPDPWGSIRSLTTVPAYLIEKFISVGRLMLSARKGANWERSSREKGAGSNHGIIPRIIMGLPIRSWTMGDTVAWLMSRVQARRPSQLVTANLDFIRLAHESPELNETLLDADAIVADGMPLVWMSMFSGPALPERVTGSDLVAPLSKALGKRKGAIFAMGGAPGVSEKALNVLQKTSPGLKIAGGFSPSREEIDNRNDEVVRKVTSASPDVLLVALGCPKQDRWISKNKKACGVPVSVGVGATLDFFAGVQIRSPYWLRPIGLEWVWRLAMEPKRLLSRYFADIKYLGSFLLHYAWVWGSEASESQRLCDCCGQGEESAIRFQRLDTERQALDFVKRCLCNQEGTVVRIDMRGIQWLSSLELGALFELSRRLRLRGGQLVLGGTSVRVSRLVELNRLQGRLVACRTCALVKDGEVGLQNGCIKGDSSSEEKATVGESPVLR
jgi:exopolysaccharide biosynthesis WecB/TagA/CpsF family protein